MSAAGAVRPRVAVVGAGAFGGWTALHLQRLGADVTLVDAWGPGNSRASSGGESRVIRAIYGADRVYSEMVKRSYELWEALDATVEEPLYQETGALWMLRGDDDSYVRAARPILSELGFPVHELNIAESARRWPQIDFAGVRKVFVEERAGVLSARRCCQVVSRRVADEGATLRIARAVPGPAHGSRLSHVVLDGDAHLSADHYVFACGPWLGHVFPNMIGERIRPTRQEVFYFGAPAGSAAYKPRRLPVWIDFGERIYYGLPDVHERGFKIADDTRGPVVDPTALDRQVTAEGLARARAFLAQRFPALANSPLVEARVCQYENSPDGDLIADRHPNLENVWVAGGGSGHGFKLSPALGEIMARAVMEDRPIPDRFRLARLNDGNRKKTQFDHD